DVYAGDPFDAARDALTDGLDQLARSVDSMVMHAIRGDGPKRTRNRPPINESPRGHLPPAGNVKPVGGRVAVPGRPPMPPQPAPGQRAGEAVGAETSVVVPA